MKRRSAVIFNARPAGPGAAPIYRFVHSLSSFCVVASRNYVAFKRNLCRIFRATYLWVQPTPPGERLPNIVLRLLNPAVPEHPSGRQALALLETQGARLTIGLQVLVETWVVATRPIDQNGLGLSAITACQILELCSQRFALVLENHTTVSNWLNLVTTTPVLGKRAHDARIAALMQSHGIAELLTLNEQDFRGMPGIATLHPSAVK